MDKNIENKIRKMLPLLNEKQKRLYLASEAEAMGYGGISQISRISGVSRVTISQGIKELKGETDTETKTEGSRREGGGRKKNDSQTA